VAWLLAEVLRQLCSVNDEHMGLFDYGASGFLVAKFFLSKTPSKNYYLDLRVLSLLK